MICNLRLDIDILSKNQRFEQVSVERLLQIQLRLVLWLILIRVPVSTVTCPPGHPSTAAITTQQTALPCYAPRCKQLRPTRGDSTLAFALASIANKIDGDHLLDMVLVAAVFADLNVHEFLVKAPSAFLEIRYAHCGVSCSGWWL